MRDEPDTVAASAMQPETAPEKVAAERVCVESTATATSGLMRGFSRVGRRLWAPALAGLVAGVVTGQMAEPRYTAQARIAAESRFSGAAESRVQIISSREFARQLLTDTMLTTRLAGGQGGEAGAHQVLAGLVGFSTPSTSRESRALRALESGLDVRALPDGQTAIAFTSPNATLSADVANRFAGAYVKLREAKAGFNMDPAGPISTAPRVSARAEPPAHAGSPGPLTTAFAAGLATFGAALGLQALLRRRSKRRAPVAVDGPPQLAAAGTVHHLPWIGGVMGGDFTDESETVPRRRLSPDGELADLSRLIELRGPAARLVVVTGPTADDGVARCALALGRSLAQADRRVVIVCLDVAAPSLEGLTVDPRAPGLTDLLFGVASFSDAIHRETRSRCHVIPPGRGAREADGLFSSDRLTLILGALEQTYDHVVVAAPPLCGVAGTEKLAELKPTLILVTQPGVPATEAVRTFDGLADVGFGDIAMVTFAEVARKELPKAA